MVYGVGVCRINVIPVLLSIMYQVVDQGPYPTGLNVPNRAEQPICTETEQCTKCPRSDGPRSVRHG